MIYRIVLRRGRYSYPDCKDVQPPVGAGSLSIVMNEEMMAMGFKPPNTKHINPRAKFYFTELGWDVFGRKLYTTAIQKGYAPKVIRLKSPKRCDTVYYDAYQVAILPKGGRSD